MTVTLELDPTLIAQAEAQAARAGTTLAQFVERLVKEEVAGAVEQSTTDAHTAAAPVLEARYEDRNGRPLPFPVLYGARGREPNTEPYSTATPPQRSFHVFAAGTGVAQGVDPRRNASLLAAADAADDARVLRSLGYDVPDVDA